MCKSAAEPGGPRRCAGDVRAKLAASITTVETLTSHHEILFRAACESAVTAGQQRHRALSRSRQAAGRRNELREEIYEYGGHGAALSEYRDAYRELLVADREVHATAAPAKAALAVLDQRRAAACAALQASGLSAAEANAQLDHIERDSTFAPPF